MLQLKGFCLILWAGCQALSPRLQDTLCPKRCCGFSLLLAKTIHQAWTFTVLPQLHASKKNSHFRGLASNWCALALVNLFWKFSETAEMFLTHSRAHQSLVAMLLWYLSCEVFDAITLSFSKLILFYNRDQDP